MTDTSFPKKAILEFIEHIAVYKHFLTLAKTLKSPKESSNNPKKQNKTQ